MQIIDTHQLLMRAPLPFLWHIFLQKQRIKLSQCSFLPCCHIAVLLILYLLFNPSASAKTQWQNLSAGLEYTNIALYDNGTRGQIHAFKIDPQYHYFELGLASAQALQVASVQQLAKNNRALLAVNGGFFTPENQPIGLRITNGTIKSALQATRWWGVFYIQEEQAYIVAQRHYRDQKNVNFAIQAGPRLVINGHIPSLKTGTAERVCVSHVYLTHCVCVCVFV